ncbi:uncharacterized protein LOC128227522 [Mya arenaria]|uniref:uncharacterized protein LOC128227522 n=1 Tax=Mya arenaria TaxID=6604 RepID=UPI0022E1F7EB|nr:uncharacterized protein LOC128227522 [Mya arenaria]
MASPATWCVLFLSILIATPFAQCFETGINLALNKNAMQYSQDPLPDGLWSAENAVDGDKTCTPVDSTHFTLSGRGNQPWWQVDLGIIYNIDRIKVYGRRDSVHAQLQGFLIHISTTAITDNTFTLPFNQTPDTNIYPANGVFDIRISVTQARYLRLILGHTSITPLNWITWPIVICEVEVFGPNERISELIQTIRGDVTVSMGIPETNGGLTFSKDKAIDHNTRTDPNACDCCSITTDGWWMIDLGRRYLIQAIQVLGRSDAHFNENKPFTVSVGDLKTNLTEIYSGNPNQGSKSYFITLNPAKVIQVIKVWKKTPAILTICEFQVYGLECLDGQFGQGCQHKGFCNGTYDMATGECLTCLAGYEGHTCSKACDKGFFGPDCIYQCGHCLTGSHCDAQTGICPQGCDNGFKGLFCNRGCEHNTYGENCTSHCGHCSSLPCDLVNGYCSGHAKVCEQGFLPPKCDTECLDGTFGDECRRNCSKNCSGGDICNKKNGLCPNGCLPGYNFTGDRLCFTECRLGTYGLNCAENCGNCRDGLYCNTQNGQCMFGCDRGYQGAECQNECEDGWYGENCNVTCGFCKYNAVCDKVSGNCKSGCDRGYRGKQCKNDEKQDESATCEGQTAVELLAAFLSVSIIGNVVTVALYCRTKIWLRQGKEDTTNHYTVPGPSMSSEYSTIDVAEMNSIPTDRHYANDG